MAAYMIIHAVVSRREAFMERYARPAAALVERFGGRYLVRAPVFEVLEGAERPGASVVVSRWPDVAAAKAFWNSADYAELRAARADLAACEVVLVEAD